MQTSVAGAIAVALALGAATIGIAVGSSSSTADPEPARVSPPPAIVGDGSLSRRAVAAALPPGETVTGVREVRSGTADYDLVSARHSDGSGLEVNVWHVFASNELDAATDSIETAGGRYWPAAEDAEIQSLYFQDDHGVAVRVAHHSSTGGARLGRTELLAFAARVTSTLEVLGRGGVEVGGATMSVSNRDHHPQGYRCLTVVHPVFAIDGGSTTACPPPEDFARRGSLQTYRLDDGPITLFGVAPGARPGVVSLDGERVTTQRDGFFFLTDIGEGGHRVVIHGAAGVQTYEVGRS